MGKKRTTIKRASARVARDDATAREHWATDSFQNFSANYGLGTDNVSSSGTYGFNPITRIRVLLEWIHRGTWIGGVAVNVVADDMTRAGVEVEGDVDPDDIERLEEANTGLAVWNQVNDTIKWARLYGGALGVILIDGQDPATPLRIESIGRGAYRGMLVLDRWMVTPTLQDLVTTYGPDLGLPKFYDVNADAPALQGRRVHYSRCLRLEGVRLPYYQRVQENLWGLSVYEPLYDRMVAFDSATTGVAQLVYKSHVRGIKIEGLRDIVAAGNQLFAGLKGYVNLMRQYQSTEGLMMLDSKDEYISNEGGAAGMRGVADVLNSFAEQISGALQIPLVRLLGQAPTGLNSAGESELRTYYDGILQKQNRELKVGVTKLYRCAAQSEQIELPDGFAIKFRPLWQLEEEQRANIANMTVDAVTKAVDGGLLKPATAMKELRQSADVTGIFSNISDEEIEEIENEPPQLAGFANTSLKAEAGAPPTPAAEGEGKATQRLPQTYEAPPKDELKRIRAQDKAYRVHGLELEVETPRGAVRSGEGWAVALPADYGFVRGVEGADGDEVDCFVGPEPATDRDVWIFNTLDPETGAFDEHKTMIGFKSKDDAVDCFKRAYHDDVVPRVHSIHRVSMDEFKRWLASGAAREKKPYEPTLRAVA